MKTVLFFVMLVGTPLIYLWQHAYSFKQCQQIAKLEEQKRRAREVNDSLQACLGSLSSWCALESRAFPLGLVPRVRLGAIVVPAALASSHKTGKAIASAPPSKGQKPIASAGAAKPPKPVAARSTQSGKSASSSGPVAASKSATGPTMPARAGQPPKAVAADDIVGAPVRPNQGGM
jgi:hypothetical protein